MRSRLRQLVSGARARERQRVADEYRTMSLDERKEIETIRRRGGEGEREIMLERAVERDEAAQQGRPLRLWRYVSGNGWFATGRRPRSENEIEKPQRT